MRKRGNPFALTWFRWMLALVLAGVIVFVVGGSGLVPFSMTAAMR